MKPRSSLRSFLAALGCATLAVSSASADSYTWTQTTSGTLDWDVTTNWLDGNVYVSDDANELIFFSDSTTYFSGTGTRSITTDVPTTLALNTLTLNGRGLSSGASAIAVTIGSSASTWTIGDGTTSIVNLNANQGATTAAGFNVTVAANLTLNQATTLFTGNGTAGVHTGNNDPGFVFSGSIGEAASGYGITKEGTSRLTLSSSSLTFTGPLTVNGGMLILTGNSNLPSNSMTVNSGAILRIGNNTATQIGTSGNYSGNISTGTGGTLQLWSSSAQEFSGIISGSGGIQKAYGGQLTLSGANTYTGKTEFRPVTTAGFTVKVSSFNSVVGGTASSSLGAPTTVANGTIDLGSGAAQATVNLTYEANAGGTATGETTDRVINLQYNGTSNRIITANNASGVLRFTSAFTSNGGTQNGKLILGGTGAGQIDQGLPQLAALGLDKQGTGTWTLGGSGLFTGPTLITAGTLSLSSATALQFSPFDTASVAGGASAGLKIATTTLSLGGLTGSNAFDTRFTTALGGPSNATAKGGYAGLTALTLTNAANTTSTYSGNIVEGATGMTLTKNGTGTQFLNGTNSYTGLTSVNAGLLGSGGSFSGAVTVNGAVLAPGASSGAFGTLTISDASSSALTLNSGNLLMDVSTGSSDLIAVTGDAVLNGTNRVLLNPTTGVAAGTYDLVTYNAKTGSGSVVFANGTTTLGNATLAVNAGEIQMTVGAGGLNNSVWVGTTATWDSGTNWNRNGAAGSAFSAGDFVTIDDTGSNAATITSAATVSPTALTVNNSTKAFVITATIGGTGTPLVKMGTNQLTLGSTAALVTNTYTGGTVIYGGTLNLAGPTSTNLNPLLGDASGGIILDGGQLRVSANNLSGARNVTIGASGGSLFVNKNNNFTTTGILTGSGTLNLLDGGGSGTPSTYNFNSTSNDFTGGIVLNNAIMSVARLDDSANNIVFNSSLGVTAIAGTSALRLGSTAAAPLTLSSRAIEINSAVTTGVAITNNNTTHAITINTDLVASGAGAKTLNLDGVAGPTNVFGGDIGNGNGGGTVALAKIGAGIWVLSGNNSYSGDTTLSAGTLRINSTTALGTGTFVISANSTFDNTSGSAITLANNNNFTLSGGSPTFTGTNDLDLGTGTVTLSGANRTITVTNAGATLTLGGGVTTDSSGARTLTKDGAGTLALNGAAGTWTGGVNINRGALKVGNATALGNGPIAFNSAANAGTLQNTTGSLITMSGSAVNIGGNAGVITTITGTAGNDWSLGTLTNTQAGNAVLTVDTVNATFAGANLSNSSSNRTLTINGTGNVTITGAVVNGGTSTASALTKSGAGTLTLNGSNTYSGVTNVNAGMLSVVGTGSINSTSAINVSAGATFAYNSSTALTVVTALNGTGTGIGERAVLSGSGTGGINTAVTLNNVGDVLSPGNSPGIMGFGTNQSWGSFSYDWELNDWANSVAGTNIDQIGITGSLTLTGATTGSYLLNILSLTGSNVTGDVPNFAETSKSWTILTTTTGISGFDASYWNLVTSGFSNNETGTWSLGLGNSGNDLVLTYAPIPEPRTALLAALGALALLRRRRN